MVYLQAPFLDFNFDLAGEWVADYFGELKEEMENGWLKVKLDIWQVDEFDGFDEELDDWLEHEFDDIDLFEDED